ncbi:hypothetical protein D3C86_1699350 [compost metagenome]
MVHAEPVLNIDGRRRKRVVGRRRGQNDQIEICGRQAGIVERRACGGLAERRRGLAFAGDVTLADAGALHDPLV